MNQTETTTYCEFEKTRMITTREFMADEPHHSNLFISGLIDRIQTLSQKEAALVAGLMKLALRQDEVGEIVRREIIQAEAINVDKGNAEPPADVLKEIYFWNGIISGIELAEYQHRQQVALEQVENGQFQPIPGADTLQVVG
ncbi:MAG: hypothetical protein JXB18_07300 [Sedimentisphaerales bacterium]|nr:hypothetical protein [Sedimentisphaerales bacterium]